MLGFGLPGMRDRLVSVGGSLRTGPLHNGGWSVNALLPYPPKPETAVNRVRRGERRRSDRRNGSHRGKREERTTSPAPRQPPLHAATLHHTTTRQQGTEP